MLELLIDMELLSQALIVKKLHLVIKSRLKILLEEYPRTQAADHQGVQAVRQDFFCSGVCQKEL